MCEKLGTAYQRKMPTPACGHCAWFHPWATNVIRAQENNQELRFAYLEQPCYAEQPQFHCTARAT